MHRAASDGRVLPFRQPLFLVTLTYIDSNKFGRIFEGLAKAEKFAAGREKSRFVSSVRIKRIDETEGQVMRP